MATPLKDVIHAGRTAKLFISMKRSFVGECLKPKRPAAKPSMTAEEMDRRRMRQRHGHLKEEYKLSQDIPKGYASYKVAPPSEHAVSMNEVLSAIGRHNYELLERELRGASGISQLAARLRAKGIEVSEWGDKWGEVRREAAISESQVRGLKKEPIEVEDLRHLAKRKEVDALVKVLGAQETVKLIKRLTTVKRGGGLVVATNIAALTQCANKGMKAKELWIKQDLWRKH